MPPEVGNAETSSDMQSPMTRMKIETIGQPHAIAAGPPLFQPRPKLVKQPARIEMIENEMAKFENPDHERLSSCLYPSSASRFSSASSGAVSTTCFPLGLVCLLDFDDQFRKLPTTERRNCALVLLHAPRPEV